MTIKTNVTGNELDNIDPSHTIVISSGALKQQVFDTFQTQLQGATAFTIYCVNIAYYQEDALSTKKSLAK